MSRTPYETPCLCCDAVWHKNDRQGGEIDSNRVYIELIKPALEAAGLEVFRADEDEQAGDIRTDIRIIDLSSWS
ncbi:MAG: hypothetical protein NTAFB01_16420 [Nitrospira sp.]